MYIINYLWKVKVGIKNLVDIVFKVMFIWLLDEHALFLCYVIKRYKAQNWLTSSSMILARFTEEGWKDENGDGDGLFILHI